MELVKYEEACRAVSDAMTLDEAKSIADKAEALRAYARQAKNRTLEIHATEIRLRAERRTGQLMTELRQAKRLKMGRARRTRRDQVLITDLGITRVLAAGLMKLGRIDQPSFDKLLSSWKVSVETLPIGRAVPLPLQQVRRNGQTRYSQKIRNSRVVDGSDPWDDLRTLDGERVDRVPIGALLRKQRQASAEAEFLSAITAALPSSAEHADDVGKHLNFEQVKSLHLAVFAKWFPCSRTGSPD